MIHTHTHTYTHRHIFIYIYIYLCIHTYIHTCIDRHYSGLAPANMVVCSETNSATAISNFHCINMLRSIIEGEFGQGFKMAAGACIDDGMAQVLSLPFCLQSCRTPTRISITAATSRYHVLSSKTPARRLPSAKHSHFACNAPRASMLWGRLPARARGRLP